MSNMTIQSTPALLKPVQTAAPTAAPAKPAEVPQIVSQADAVHIKSAASGALRGGLTAAGAAAIPGLIYLAKSGGGVEKLLSMYIAGGSAVAAGATGAVAGAVTAKVTSNPFVGALLGAAVGAASGAAAGGALGRSMNGAATGAVVGAVGGLVGGIAGTYASEKK